MGEWSAARPGRNLPPRKTRYPFYRRLGGPQGRSGRAENPVPTGIRSRTVQPLVSRYTDWATRPTHEDINVEQNNVESKSISLRVYSKIQAEKSFFVILLARSMYPSNCVIIQMRTWFPRLSVYKLDTSVSQYVQCNMAAGQRDNIKPVPPMRTFINQHTCFYYYCSSFCAQIVTSYNMSALQLLDVTSEVSTGTTIVFFHDISNTKSDVFIDYCLSILFN